jgi:hypothetical protein
MAWEDFVLGGTSGTLLSSLADVDDYYTAAYEGNQWQDVELMGSFDGELESDLYLAPKTSEIEVSMVASDLPGLNTKHDSLAKALKGGAVMDLVRRRELTTGQESHVTRARLRLRSPQLYPPQLMKAVIEVRNVRGCWFNVSSETIAPGVGVAVKGDVRTPRMEITLTGGTNPLLVNSVNGFQVQFMGTPASYGGVIIRPHNAGLNGPIAQAVSGGADLTHLLSRKHYVAFRLEPGLQNITYTGGGSASIKYWPAHE